MIKIHSHCCPGCWRPLRSFLGWLGRLRRVLVVVDTPGLIRATPGSWLRLRWHQYGWSCCPARVVDGALPPALHVVAELAWPSLVHVWLVLLVLCDGWRSGALRRLDRRHKEETHRCIVQYTLTLLSGFLAPSCVPRVAPGPLQRGLEDAGTWGDARQLAGSG